jgi:sRNA-binding carbon storage regulator CsrA
MPKTEIPNPLGVVEEKAGYLVLRIREKEGIFINDTIEVRIAEIRSMKEVQLAIRAPKSIPIRKKV